MKDTFLGLRSDGLGWISSVEPLSGVLWGVSQEITLCNSSIVRPFFSTWPPSVDRLRQRSFLQFVFLLLSNSSGRSFEFRSQYFQTIQRRIDPGQVLTFPDDLFVRGFGALSMLFLKFLSQTNTTGHGVLPKKSPIRYDRALIGRDNILFN